MDALSRPLCARMCSLDLIGLRRNGLVEKVHEYRFLCRRGICDAMLEQDAAQLGYRDLVCIDSRLEVPVFAACVGHCCQKAGGAADVTGS